MKHKISLEQIEKFISKSKDKAIAEKFTAGIDSYKILCDYISEKMELGEFVPIKVVAQMEKDHHFTMHIGRLKRKKITESLMMN